MWSPISAFREFIERIIGEAEDDDFGYQPNAAPTIPLMEVKRWFWWMDREMQISQLARSLSSRSAAAPVFAVVRCRSDDHHRFLRHRLERGEDTFDSNSPYANMLPGIPVHDVEFPGESENAKASLTSMQERLRSQIMGASTKTTDVVEAFNSAQSPQCVFSTVVCEGGLLSAAQAELLAGWLENWKAIGGAPNRALNHPVLVLVFIVCDTESAELPKRSLLDWVMGRQKAYVDPNEWLDGLTNAKHNHVAVQRFENLGDCATVGSGSLDQSVSDALPRSAFNARHRRYRAPNPDSRGRRPHVGHRATANAIEHGKKGLSEIHERKSSRSAKW